MIYSHSRLETFKTCPKKFYYNYIEKPDIEKKNSIEAFMGSMVHLALEKLYTDLKFLKINSLDQIIDYYLECWNKEYDEKKIEIVRTSYSKDNYMEMGKQYLTDYYNRYKPFDQGKTIGLEMQIPIRFYDEDTDTLYNLTGYIDRLTLVSEDHIEIHDYKTNKNPKNQLELDCDKQLALYQIAIEKMYPDVKKIDLVWHFLSVDLEMRSSRSKDQLENLEKEIISIIKEIEHARRKDYFPTNPSALCDWCEFKMICPMTAHNQKTKNITDENEYLNEPGVKLVEEYKKLNSEKKKVLDEIDPKLEKLKEAIIKYSIDNNLEKIVGLDSSLLVKCYENYKLPGKDTKERELLENLIKDNNLWIDLSDLSYIKITEFVNNSVFSEEFLNKISLLLNKEKTHRIYQNSKK
ncbi:MAG: PD-(D/E)XK nuclease family protein [Candidatus ainarchaeum sp.]|nr:PD-(D/E)XK nuclease family protein [Candidatus ainarchaeum sp.]